MWAYFSTQNVENKTENPLINSIYVCKCMYVCMYVCISSDYNISIIILIKLISLKFFLGQRLILRSYTFQFRFLALSHMNEVDLSWLPLKRQWSGLLSSLLGQELYNVVTTYLIGNKKSSWKVHHSYLWIENVHLFDNN